MPRKSSADGSYRTIDPRTHCHDALESFRKLTFDPAHLTKEQIRLWSDMALLWQRTATRGLFNARVEPSDLRLALKTSASRMKHGPKTCLYDHVKQYYLLMSRYLLSIDRRCKRRRSAHLCARQSSIHAPVYQFIVANQLCRNQSGSCSRQRSRRVAKTWSMGLRNLLEDIERGGGRAEAEDEPIIGISVWRKYRDLARQGGLPKRADATHPVCTLNSDGSSPAAAHRPALDQQILHTGSQAEELVHQMVC